MSADKQIQGDKGVVHYDKQYLMPPVLPIAVDTGLGKKLDATKVKMLRLAKVGLASKNTFYTINFL